MNKLNRFQKYSNDSSSFISCLSKIFRCKKPSKNGECVINSGKKPLVLQVPMKIDLETRIDLLANHPMLPEGYRPSAFCIPSTSPLDSSSYIEFPGGSISFTHTNIGHLSTFNKNQKPNHFVRSISHRSSESYSTILSLDITISDDDDHEYRSSQVDDPPPVDSKNNSKISKAPCKTTNDLISQGGLLCDDNSNFKSNDPPTAVRTASIDSSDRSIVSFFM